MVTMPIALVTQDPSPETTQAQLWDLIGTRLAFDQDI